MIATTSFLGKLVATCLATRFHAHSALDVYVQRVFGLVNKHSQEIARLRGPANVTASALLAGGTFYLAGDPAWVSEGTGRAGGLLSTSPFPSVDQFKKLGEMFGEPPHGVVIEKGDVIWLSYSSETISLEVAAGKDLEQKGCLVVAFGPRPPNGPPEFKHWIDSLTPWDADTNFTLLGNIFSLWTLVAELAATVTRHGRTLAFYQSLVIYGARERNDLYIHQRSHKGSISLSYPPVSPYHTGVRAAFHDGIPRMRAVQAGKLAFAYLEHILHMLREIKENELDDIINVGREMARRASESHPATLMVLGHMIPYAVSREGKLFHYLELNNDSRTLRNSLEPNGYFVWLGYASVPLDLWYAVRRAGARAVWIVAPLPGEVDFRQYEDIVIDQHWLIGDGTVNVPEYDIRILPVSAVAQLFIYELLLRASEPPEGSKSSS